MKRILIFPDVHSYNFDRKAWGCFIEVARSLGPWDHVVGLGDLLEGDAVSAYNKGRPQLQEGLRLLKDYAFAGELLDELQNAVGPQAAITLLKGNHEWRVDRYLEEHPELDGLINVEQGLKLKERNITMCNSYPDGATLQIGKLHFTHGIYCGGNAAKKHLENFGVNLVFGHTHEVGMASKKMFGKGKTLSAWNMGCLCRYDMPYLVGRPTSWQHAIGTAYVSDTGMFSVNTHLVFAGTTIINGKMFRTRSRRQGVTRCRALPSVCDLSVAD